MTSRKVLFPNRLRLLTDMRIGGSLPFEKKLDSTIVSDCWMFPASECRTRRNEREHGDLLDAAGMPLLQPSTILRVVLPKLATMKIVWKGWHGFRRGVATELHRNGVSDFVIQKALRHANIVVTQESYIKTVPEVVIDAMGVLAKKRNGRVGAVAISQKGTA